MAQSRQCQICGGNRFKFDRISNSYGFSCTCCVHDYRWIEKDDINPENDLYECSFCGDNNFEQIYSEVFGSWTAEETQPTHGNVSGLTSLISAVPNMSTSCGVTKNGVTCSWSSSEKSNNPAKDLENHRGGARCPLVAGQRKAKPNNKGKAKAEQPQPVVQQPRTNAQPGPSTVARATIPRGVSVVPRGHFGESESFAIPRAEIQCEVVKDSGVKRIDCETIVGKRAAAGVNASGLRSYYARATMIGYVVSVSPLISEGASWHVAYVLVNSAQQEEEPVDFQDLLGMASKKDPRLVFSSEKDKKRRTVEIEIATGWSLYGAYKSISTATTTGVTGVKAFQIEQEAWFSLGYAPLSTR